LIALGHEIKAVADSYMDYGAGQMLVSTDDGYAAGSDARRDGQASGF
jgi:gamma-glutamyltranspeptidase/glutathione hydrolase